VARHASPGRGYAPRGSVAERRHPRPGTGTGGYYRPYYRPYFYGSLSFGWPYYGVWPYYGDGYSYYPGYSVGYDAPAPSSGYYEDDALETAPRDADRDTGRIRLEVRPDDASVYVDDEFRGTARETRSLTLPAGRHRIELVRPGYATERREVDVASGERRDVLVEMAPAGP